MVAAEVTMPCRLGLHMRAAAHFFNFVRQFRSEIKVRKGKFTADAKSIIGLLALGVTWRSKLLIEAEGIDAERAIKEIKEYFLKSEHCLD
jgi:phosphotransferase system HPr (HPr) family protein